MSKKMPLDMSEIQDDGSGEVPELEIVNDQRHGAASRKNASLSDADLNDSIARHKEHLKLPLKDNGAKLQAALKELEEEKLHRANNGSQVLSASKGGIKSSGHRDNLMPRITRSGHSLGKLSHVALKTDCNWRQSKGLGNTESSFCEEIDIFQIQRESKGKRPFQQISANSELSSQDRTRNECRVFSGDLAGPSPRQIEGTGEKHCDRCNAVSISSTIETNEDDVLGGPCMDQLRRKCDFSAKESSKLSPPSGTALRRKDTAGRRSGRDLGGVSVEKVVELFSSEDEDEIRIQDNFVERVKSNQRINGSGSTPDARTIVGTKIAYPTREDPDAVEVLRTDLNRLAPMEFLNDTVIDFYIKYIQRPEVQKKTPQSRFYFFNSFFYKKLSEIASTQSKKNVADLSKLSKWTKGTNIFQKDYLFVPIHDKWHWSLAIICHPGAASEDSDVQPYILHLDSMCPGHKSNAVFKLLRTYLRAEWHHQTIDGMGISNRDLTFDDFPVKKIQVPQQENESDCGLFLLHYIECFLKEPPSPFQMSDVERGKLFGRNWFKPSEASDLRKVILDLLTGLFESSRTSEISAPIQGLAHQHPENQSVFGLRTLDFHETADEEEVTTAVPSSGLASLPSPSHEITTPNSCRGDVDSPPSRLPCEDAERTERKMTNGSISVGKEALACSNDRGPDAATEQASSEISSPPGGLDLATAPGSRDKHRGVCSADNIEHVVMTTEYANEANSGNDDDGEVGLVVDICPPQEGSGLFGK